MSPTNEDAIRADVDSIEKKMAGELDPGARALVVALLVLILLGSFALPHTGAARGYDVLMGDDAALQAAVALPSRVFSWLALVFGVGFSMLALVTRRWALAWIAVAGSGIASVFGMLSIWSRQTVGIDGPGGGVGVGLVVGAIAVILLTFHWIRAVWSRTALQLEAEEQRRLATAERERQTDWRNPR